MNKLKSHGQKFCVEDNMTEIARVDIKQEVEDTYTEYDEPYTDIGDFLECAVKDEAYSNSEGEGEQDIYQSTTVTLDPEASTRSGLVDNDFVKIGSSQIMRKFSRVDTRKKRVRPPKPKIHQCEMCDKAFSNVFHLRDHISSHTQERVECKVCRVILRTTSLRAHMYRHNNNKSHQCKFCLEKFVRKYSLKEHMLNVHTNESITCPICFKTLRRSSFHKHMSLHKNKMKHKCEACGKGFNTISKLKNHLVTHTNERPFTCNDCGAGFKNKEGLKAHFRSHTGEAKTKNLACDMCSKKYSDPSHLALHKKRHLGIKSHACDFCNRKFLLKSSLRSHLRIHAVHKPFRCQECGRGFDYLNLLNQHIRIVHLGEGAVVCTICNKTFTQQASLTKHRKKFHNVQSNPQFNFRCDECNKNFRSGLSFETHMQMHTGERGFTCNVCSKKFRHKTGLLRHVKTHAELQFECRTCGWTFTDPKRFASHINLHLMDKPYGCTQPGCDKKFPRLSALNRHLRGAHRFWCEQCKKTFTDAAHYERHASLHKLNRGHMCRSCGKIFALRTSLDVHNKTRRHVRSKKRLWCEICMKNFYDPKAYAKHANVHSDKGCVCPVCNRKFRSEGGLTTHQDKDHTVHIEQYWCDVCDVGFNDDKLLRNHTEFHTGKRVLACAVCFRAYTHKATLNRHVKTHGAMAHTARFRCKLCAKTFGDSRPYGNHLKLHSGEHPYECELCGRTFRNALNLVYHKKKIHKIDV